MKSRHLFLAVCCALALTACSSTNNKSNLNDVQNDKRTFNPMLNYKWIGNGISYGAYRDGEEPEVNITSKENIKEDMDILAHRWNLIRLYGADAQAENILKTIKEHRLPIKVMQGIWLDAHKTDAQNTLQVDTAIRLANEFPEVVVAVNVGNEILVDWSHHKLDDIDDVVAKIRKVRSNIEQPVTVADDYNFWNKPHAQKVAAELDFICLHAYAFWNNKTIDMAMQWTIDTYNTIQNIHPTHNIAYCETGWPTSRIWNDGSYEGGLIGKANEENQKLFFDEYDQWVQSNNVISFYFSSFDEKWKGGMDGENPMAKAEKHWGLYFSDRTAKKVLED